MRRRTGERDRTMSDHPAEIAETGATGETAVLYKNIRRHMGVGMVNLIHRRMAARPGVLPWAWAMLRPLFADGSVEAETERLRPLIATGDAAQTPREAFFAAGLNDHILRTVRMILDDYNRANLANLVAIGALARFLESGGAARPARDPGEIAKPGLERRLPPIRGMDDMDDATADLVRVLSAGFGPEDAPIIPSLYRHLALWPTYLGMAAAGELAPARLAAGRERGDALHRDSRSSAGKLADRMAPVPGIAAPPEAEIAALAKMAGAFAAGPIAAMTAVGHRLRASLPEIPPHKP